MLSPNWEPEKEWYGINVVPTFRQVPSEKNVEWLANYHRQQLMLHKPGSSEDDFEDKSPDEIRDQFDKFLESPDCPKCVMEKYYAESSTLETADDLAPEVEENEDEPDPWMLALGMAGKKPCGDDDDVAEKDSDDDDELSNYGDGERAVNVNDPEIDWQADRIELIPELSKADVVYFLAKCKSGYYEADADDDVEAEAEHGESINLASLTEKQRLMFDLILNHIADRYNDMTTNKTQVEPMLIDLCGQGGSGKTYVLKCILQELKSRFGSKIDTFVKCAAPTGSAAHQLPNGTTLHSLFNIPIGNSVAKPLQPLSGSALQRLQENLKETWVVIIDEKSMIGQYLFYQIEARCREAKPARSSDLFSGISFLLMGDINQLAPVNDIPLFSPTPAPTLRCDRQYQAQGRDRFLQFKDALSVSYTHLTLPTKA